MTNSLAIADRDLRQLVDAARNLALDYWREVEALPAFPQTSGQETTALFSKNWPEVGLGPNVLQDFPSIANHSRPSGGKFFGYVMGSGEPVGAVGDFLAAVLNQNVTSWRSAPAATAIEHTVVGWLAEAIGCHGFSGTLCGGGTAANLMGLAMAREAKCAANETGAKPCVVYASEEVHMSTPGAMALLGIGRQNLRLIATDKDFRMRADALESAIAEDRRANRTPIAVVATAGTVQVGSIDPLSEIAAIAQRENLWLHVDGSFGALAAIAIPGQFAGLEKADSISLDAHKWLYQSVDCACLLYRDPAAARKALSQSSEYVRSFSSDPTEGFIFFGESIELSRRFRALKLWMSLQYHGRAAFRGAMLQDIRHARLLAQIIARHDELEIMAPVALSAVCFRHRSKDNEAILRHMIARGRVYISNAKIDGQFALRACFVNHRTTESDVEAIVTETLAAAAEVNS